ncbi:MAG: adenylate/guanylate cyclase domain-containing protein [Desulfuromonadaceae bacterium]|nr:adenylate/guanylate cyclase domain-containing protein [Desulfuromonadaceae bacterium]
MNKLIIFKPGSWPIAIKLAVVMLLFSILPMLATAQYGLGRAFDNIVDSEMENLQRFSAGLSERIELIITNTGYIASYLSWDREVAELLRKRDEHTRSLVLDKMLRLQTANSAIELVMLLDTGGKVIASTIPMPPEMDFGFRDYFKAALKGNEFVSSILVGSLTKKAGIFFSAPIYDSSGVVMGVTVLKLNASAITSLLGDMGKGGSKRAFLIDADGIVVYHPDARLMYQSLAPLAPEVKEQIISEKRFMTDRIGSLGLESLQQLIKKVGEQGNARYYSTPARQNELVGFSPLKRMGWTVAVEMPESALSVPLDRIYLNFMAGVGVFGLFLALVSALFAGTFVKPLRVLMVAARAVERGDYKNARVTVKRLDEIGELSNIFNTMAEGVQARERERDILGRVVSPEVRDKLLSGDINLVGENRRVSILFSDIRGFTTLSEQMHPHDVVAMLNEYLGEMSEAVKHHGGYINNFIGDAIVVIFGAPLGWEDNEERALRAAVEMRARLKILNVRRAAQGENIIESGIGISTGKVVAGQVGSSERFLYTVIGDSVNIASRLETLTKEYPDNPILINAATYEKVKDTPDFTFKALGSVTLKGKAEAIEIFAGYPAA